MYIVMNRIPVHPDYSDQFEERFTNRVKAVDQMPGFIRNQVLRPTAPEEPYIVLTMWQSKEDFDNWVNSDAFKKGHARSGTLPKDAFLGHAKLEAFDVILDTQSS